MRELPKWFSRLLDWLPPQSKPQQLLPRQEVVGDKAVQLGQVGGSVTIVHLTLPPVPVPVTTLPPAPVPPAAAKPVARFVPSAVLPTRSAGVANEAQRQVLHLIRQVPYPAAVHEFMQREFGTHMVIHLQPPQLYRVRRYVEAILKSGVPPAGVRPFQAPQGNP